MPPCVVCNKAAIQSCSACNSAYYCCKQHQKTDWKNHKNSCAPYKIAVDAKFGRHLVATRNIRQGEVILRKLPIILAPKTVSVALCLGCHKKLDRRYYCAKCQWPLCGENCQNSPWHRSECQVFSLNNFKPYVAENGTKQSVYSCVAPLRALLLKRNDPKLFEILTNFQSHLTEHLQSPIYKILKANLVPIFTNLLKLNTDEEEILKICSIFDTNSFQVRDVKGSVNIRGLYPTMSLLSHDCKHNTKHVFNENANYQLVLTATVPIKKGDQITTTYTQTLWGTLDRRSHLRSSKHFDCSCPRCSDATEFGTYTSAISCTNCESGKLISGNPLDRAANWKCDSCDYVEDSTKIVAYNSEMRRQIGLLQKTPEAFEEFLVKHQNVLHKTNGFCLEIKYALAQIYGNFRGYRLNGNCRN